MGYYDRHERNKVLGIIFGIVLGCLVCAFVGHAITPSAIAGPYFWFRSGWPIWSGLIIAAVGLVLLVVIATEQDSSVTGWVGATMLVVGILLCFVQIPRNYNVQRELLQTVDVQEGWTYEGGFQPRFVHYDNAIKMLENSMGEYHGTALRNVTFVNGRWTGLADGTGFVVPLKAVLALNPDGTIDRCEMNVSAAVDGLFGNSVVNRIRRERLFVRIVHEDIYGDCVDGVGTIYIPLTTLQGLWGVPKPAGLAVMDSHGYVTIYDEYRPIPVGTPGPVYPESIDITQQNSLDSARGFWAWVFGNYGFEETSGEADPNTENSGQYNLALVGSTEQYYVTPLTAKGTSRSFVGFTVVHATAQTPGQYNRGVFVRFPEPVMGVRQRAETTRNEFDLDWYVLTVQEIVPGPGDTFVGYVGQPTVLSYIVTYYHDGRMEIEVVGDAPLPGESDTVGPVVSVVGEDLSELPDEELLELLRAVSEEAQRRWGAGNMLLHAVNADESESVSFDNVVAEAVNRWGVLRTLWFMVTR